MGTWTILAVLLCACIAGAGGAFGREAVVIEIPNSETAGICGFRAMWDAPVATADDGVRRILDDVIKDRGGSAPWNSEERDGGAKPAALAFDAIHRSLLVRFPAAADQIAEQLRKGFRIQKAELVLPYADTELWPWGNTNWAPPEGGYLYRANWGVDKDCRAVPPTWHAAAWALRKPWKSDAATGPTWNAWINGAGYWARFGAQDEQADRFPSRFGPAPVAVVAGLREAVLVPARRGIHPATLCRHGEGRARRLAVRRQGRRINLHRVG